MKLPTLLPKSLATLIALSSIEHNLLSAEVDPGFSAEIRGTVHAVVVDATGNLIVGGQFDQVNGSPRANLVRVSPAGDLDASFSLQPDGAVFALELDPTGGLAIGGGFNSPSRNFARIQADGVLAPLTLGSSTSSRIDCLSLAPDGSTVIGGSFHRLNGGASIYTAKVTAAGVADVGFTSALFPSFSMEAGADAIAQQADGKVIVGGNFETPAGFRTLARLNPDGSLDATFDTDHGPTLYVKVLKVLSDGKILVAGVANSAGQGFVRRLNSDGSIDTSFQEALFNGCVEALAVESTGSMVVGGSFEGGLARLNPDGTADPLWNIATDGVVKALATDGDDSVIVGGAFGKVGERTLKGLARLTLRNRVLVATNANGRFMARIQGESGRKYEVQASSDFAAWTSLGIVTASEGGIDIADSTAGGRSHRFYRARLVP